MLYNVAFSGTVCVASVLFLPYVEDFTRRPSVPEALFMGLDERHLFIVYTAFVKFQNVLILLHSHKKSHCL